MSLTKDDLQQIKNIVVKPLSEEIAKNRDEIAKSREEIQQRPTAEATANMFAKQNLLLGNMMSDVFLAQDKVFVSREEFEELKQAVESLRVKLG